ncbi:MAG: hypothetical protein ACOX7F_06565 [Eubacteriales bacterium]|jgi:hypothetical protein
MREWFDRSSLTELACIVICGVGLVLGIVCRQQEIAMCIGGGLVGYLGGVYGSGN